MKRIIDYIMVAVKGACMGAADVRSHEPVRA